MTAAPPPLPAIIGGKYRPLRLIARGGMGAVYEVVHVNTGEHLALKLMLARSLLAPHLVERFRREARIQSSVRSEHVVRVVDADVAPELDGAPFLVMELLAGNDLERICSERQPSREEVVDWLRQVGRALDKAHKERIIHRDLKPENLFLAEREELPPIVKILDFGVAKLTTEGDDGSTITGQILGTPRYMAPEQAAGARRISAAADRFALGLIAFRLLSGRHYFEGDNWVALLQAVPRGPTSRPSEMGCDRGAAFDAWFARACALNPMQRFGTCAEQVDALAGALEGASFRWRRKLWPPTPAMALGAVAGSCGIVVLAWSMGRGWTTASPPRAGALGAEQAPVTAAPMSEQTAQVIPEAVVPVAPSPEGGNSGSEAGLPRSAPATGIVPPRLRRARGARISATTPEPKRPAGKDRIWEEP